MAAGIGAGGVVMAPFIGYMLSRFDWRAAYLSMAILIVAVAAVAFVAQLVFTYLVYWKAYLEKRGQNEGAGARPALLEASKTKTGWSKGYYQGVVLLATNALVALLLAP